MPRADVVLIVTMALGALSMAPRAHRTCPAGGVLIADTYCIDRYEGSLVRLLPRGVRRAWSPYETPREGARYAAQSRRNVVPQGYISQEQAAAACAGADKRLCTETEWSTACRGPAETLWPYGPTRIAGRCNDSGDSPVLRLFAPSRDVFHVAQMNDPRLNTLPHTLARTARFAQCTNAFGVFDMVGNLHEWIDARHGRLGVFRGGYYQDTHLNGDGCSYATRAHGRTYHDYSTGFRCCADPR